MARVSRSTTPPVAATPAQKGLDPRVKIAGKVALAAIALSAIALGMALGGKPGIYAGLGAMAIGGSVYAIRKVSTNDDCPTGRTHKIATKRRSSSPEQTGGAFFRSSNRTGRLDTDRSNY